MNRDPIISFATNITTKRCIYTSDFAVRFALRFLLGLSPKNSSHTNMTLRILRGQGKQVPFKNAM
jgi:hypothetical protein